MIPQKEGVIETCFHKLITKINKTLQSKQCYYTTTTKKLIAKTNLKLSFDVILFWLCNMSAIKLYTCSRGYCSDIQSRPGLIEHNYFQSSYKSSRYSLRDNEVSNTAK